MRGPDAERLRLEFERWRAASPLNRKLYEDMQAISRETQRLGDSVVVREYHDNAQRRSTFARPGLALLAASVAGTILAGSAAYVFTHRHSAPPAMAATAPLVAPVGQIRTLRLADGTSVTLDADSEIAPSFDASTRFVRLVRGRARFDVAHDAARPFMVEAGNRVILDKGTVFDVAIGRDGVRVSLLRGAVEIHERSPAIHAAGRVMARLSPGQSFVDGNGTPDRPQVVASNGTDSWSNGTLSFDGAPLADVIADLNRYSTRKLRLADPKLANLRVTGVFKAVPIEGVAKALAVALKLRVASAANGDLILQH
jgi:transmembrane sensor